MHKPHAIDGTGTPEGGAALRRVGESEFGGQIGEHKTLPPPVDLSELQPEPLRGKFKKVATMLGAFSLLAAGPYLPDAHKVNSWIDRLKEPRADAPLALTDVVGCELEEPLNMPRPAYLQDYRSSLIRPQPGKPKAPLDISKTVSQSVAFFNNPQTLSTTNVDGFTMSADGTEATSHNTGIIYSFYSDRPQAEWQVNPEHIEQVALANFSSDSDYILERDDIEGGQYYNPDFEQVHQCLRDRIFGQQVLAGMKIGIYLPNEINTCTARGRIIHYGVKGISREMCRQAAGSFVVPGSNLVDKIPDHLIVLTPGRSAADHNAAGSNLSRLLAHELVHSVYREHDVRANTHIEEANVKLLEAVKANHTELPSLVEYSEQQIERFERVIGRTDSNEVAEVETPGSPRRAALSITLPKVGRIVLGSVTTSF